MATTTSPSSPRDLTGQVLTEAARRMLPVLATKLLTAVVDQAVSRVDDLADRLEDRHPGARAVREDPEPGASGGSPPSRSTTAVAFVVEQLRAVLAVVVRLAAQALEMLRRATERLRARRAPEGIDAEAEALEDEDDEGLDDGEPVDEDDDYVDGEVVDEEYDDEYDDEPAMAGR